MKENLITARIMAARNIAGERKEGTTGIKEKAREKIKSFNEIKKCEKV